MKRRSFIEMIVKGSLAAGLMKTTGCASPIKTGGSDQLGPLMPTRELGKTGKQLTMFGVGGAHMARMDDAKAERHVEFAIENGVRFFDTAYVYYKGRSERLLGKYVVPKYRDQAFIMTKTWSKTAKQCEDQVVESLRRMKIDQVDLLMIHSFENAKDVDDREKGGVFEKVQELQERGLAKYIGYTCHSYTSAPLRFLEKIKGKDYINACMTPINPVDAANKKNSFARDVMPKNIERGISHFAMKTMAGGGLMGGKMTPAPRTPKRFPIPEVMSIEENMLFALSMPITVWVSGTNNIEQLKHNIDLAKSVKRLNNDDKAKLIAKVAGYAGEPDLEWYKEMHPNKS